MADPDRILTMRDCTAMAALDTMPHLATRVRNLLAHGRRITVTRRLTYSDTPPEVHTGLTVDEVQHQANERYGQVFAHLKPGITMGFGIHAYAGENDTEAAEWARFHDGEATSDRWDKRRRDMTWVRITGGLPDSGPGSDDKLIIRHWNKEGVCIEKVIVFDAGPREGEYRAARWLYGNALGPAHVGDRLEAWDRGRVSDADAELWAGRAAELMAEVAAEPR